jgi:hypothetical protein
MRLSFKFFKVFLIILDVMEQKDIVFLKIVQDFKEIFNSEGQRWRFDKISIFAIIFLCDKEVCFILGLFGVFRICF